MGMETAINTMRKALIIFQNTRFKPFVEYGQKRIGQKATCFRKQEF
jgi:hypothetical protein